MKLYGVYVKNDEGFIHVLDNKKNIYGHYTYIERKERGGKKGRNKCNKIEC